VLWIATSSLGQDHPPAGIKITNQTEKAITYQVSHADDDNSAARDVTLEPGKAQSFSEDRPLLCRFQSQSKPLEYVLSPGRSYVFYARGEGGFDLRRAKTGSDGVDLGTRELKVLAVADQEYRRRYPKWEARVRGLIADVSNHFDDDFGIHLSVTECQAWNRPVPTDNSTVPLVQLFDRPTG